MSVSQDQTTVKVSGVAEMAALVPYVFGYVPSGTVVVPVLSGGQTGGGCRIDADAPVEAVREALEFVRGCEASRALVIGFANGAEGVEAACATTCGELAAMDVETVSAIVRDGMVEVPGEQPQALEDLAHVAAPFVALGTSPLASREELAALLSPVRAREDVRERMSQSPSTPTPEACASAWARVLDPKDLPVRDLPADVLATAAFGLNDTGVRDAIIAACWLEGGAMKATLEASLGEDREVVSRVLTPVLEDVTTDRLALSQRLVDLAGATPEGEHRAGVITMVGTGLYAEGRGTEAGILLEEAAEEGYRLAVLTLTMLRAGMRFPKA